MRSHRHRVGGLYPVLEYYVPSRWSRLPLLQLCGQWLLEAGFSEGDAVRVEVPEPGRLVVQRLTEGEEEEQSGAVEGSGPTAGEASAPRRRAAREWR